jgi:hypothetical protein
MTHKHAEQWLADHFQPGPPTRWRRRLMGDGSLIMHHTAMRLVLPRASHTHYSNAQLDDYLGLSHRNYPWHPPLRLIVRARFGGPLLGTAGFGFWNHPFVPLPIAGVPLSATGAPIPPRAIWFFHASPPNDIAIARGVPGRGWKAATIDTCQPSALRWAPLAPIVVLLNRWPALERRIWPHVQHDLRISEAVTASSPHDWHDYMLEWRRDGARFTVDGHVVMDTDRSPAGPLGFVAWIDNQYAIATRWGRLGYGLLDVPEPQWLDLQQVQIAPL